MYFEVIASQSSDVFGTQCTNNFSSVEINRPELLTLFFDARED